MLRVLNARPHATKCTVEERPQLMLRVLNAFYLCFTIHAMRLGPDFACEVLN